MADGKENVHNIEPLINVHNFSKESGDRAFYFHVLQLEGSLFFWIGNVNKMGNLCVAMNTKYDDSPAVSVLLGDLTDMSCSPLAQRLAKKTQKQCFVSGSLDKTFLGFVEKAIIQEMSDNPQWF